MLKSENDEPENRIIFIDYVKPKGAKKGVKVAQHMEVNLIGEDFDTIKDPMDHVYDSKKIILWAYVKLLDKKKNIEYAKKKIVFITQ